MKRFILRTETTHQDPSYRIDYPSLLNTAQLKAVYHTNGPALVVAGAGTGKTRTLTYRVARLIESGVAPDQILLLTFTRRAAEEMLVRASTLLDGRCKHVRGGTFHSFCHSILSQHRPGYTVIDTDDAGDVMQLARSESGASRNGSLFPNKNTLLAMHSTSVNRREPLGDVIIRRYPAHQHQLDEIGAVIGRFKVLKEEQRLMDFDDLLTAALTLLTEDDAIRARVSGGIRHLMMDEYQDTNTLQADLVSALSSVHGNVMAVGDDAQSIYAFRGADHRHIMSFPERFPGAVTITLEENYRSVQPILTVANRLLEKAASAYPKRLTAHRGDGDLPAVVKAGSTEEQSRFLCQMILSLRESGSALGDVAVLFRNSRDSFDLETALAQRGIPFVKYGGARLSESAHVKDVLSVFRVLVNPADGVAWNRALSLLDGVGPKTAADFIEFVRQRSFDWSESTSFTAGARYKDQIRVLLTLLTDLKSEPPSTAKAFRRVCEWYMPILMRKFDDHAKRAQDLDVLQEVTSRYATYSELVSKLSLEPVDSTVVDVDGADPSERPLVLSTIHSAKGLEWPVVFVLQCLDGVLPSVYGLNDPEQLDEELRLTYVAATRAKDMLFFTYPAFARNGNGDYFTKPSRFLDGFPESVLEPWLLVQEEGPALLEGSVQTS